MWRRVRAHGRVAALALIPDRIGYRKVERAELDLLSSHAVPDAARLVEFELPGGRRKARVSFNGEPGGAARELLRAPGPRLEPPQPPDYRNQSLRPPARQVVE